MLTPHYEPQMNYLRLVFAWVELFGFLILFLVTVFRFGRTPLAVTRRNLALTALGWIGFLLLHWLPVPDFSVWMTVDYMFRDWGRFVLLVLSAIGTVRIWRGWREKKTG